MAIFLDTGFFLGLIHTKDQNHNNSIKLMEALATGEYGLIYTSSLIISECATIILIRTNQNIDLIHDFYSILYGKESFARILPWNRELELKTWQLFIVHNQKAKTKKEILSFVDASNISYCTKYNIDKIIAFDGDFDPYLIRII